MKCTFKLSLKNNWNQGRKFYQDICFVFLLFYLFNAEQYFLPSQSAQ